MTDHVFTPLCKLALKYATDKGGWHYIAGDTCHNYTPVYDKLYSARREEVKAVLEIGVNHGCSVRMWEEYFPNAQIVGLDCNAGCLFNKDRIRCFAADQNNGESLDTALRQAGIDKYDLIVDDGSHEFHHQVFSAQHLIPRYLAKDGWYIIEDIGMDCQPWLVADAVGIPGMVYMDAGVGLGKAHCMHCDHGETLIGWKGV